MNFNTEVNRILFEMPHVSVDGINAIDVYIENIIEELKTLNSKEEVKTRLQQHFTEILEPLIQRAKDALANDSVLSKVLDVHLDINKEELLEIIQRA